MLVLRPQIAVRQHGDRVCRVCGLRRCQHVLVRLATPSMHPFAFLHSCAECLGVVRELFRSGSGHAVVRSGRQVTLVEQNAVTYACQVCAFEAVTHGLGVDDACVLRMCSHCGGAIRDAICAS